MYKKYILYVAMHDEVSEIPVLPHPRRGPLHPSIDEALIERVVRTFYAKVRRDPLLAPIFAEKIPGDWEPHLRTMMRFWSSVMLMSGRYKGQPVVKHQALEAIGDGHFARWLALFDETVRDLCTPEAAALFNDRAGKIADSLRRAMLVTAPSCDDAEVP